MNRPIGTLRACRAFTFLGALDKVTAEAEHGLRHKTMQPRRNGTPDAASTAGWPTTQRVKSMKNGAMVTVIMLGMFLGTFAIGFSLPSSAQNAVGGATKMKPSTIGGAAKPAPVIGGATKPSSVVGAPKQNAIGATAKQGSVGGTATPGSTGSAVTPNSTGGLAKQNPPVVPPNKGGTVVTSNLKCAAGACVAKGTKP
jgi:hypothetical protein